MPTKQYHNPFNPNKSKLITVAEYLALREWHYDRLWTLIGGVLKTKVNGQYLTEAQFNRRYPLFVDSFHRAKENPCKKNAFLN